MPQPNVSAVPEWSVQPAKSWGTDQMSGWDADLQVLLEVDGWDRIDPFMCGGMCMEVDLCVERCVYIPESQLVEFWGH